MPNCTACTATDTCTSCVTGKNQFLYFIQKNYINKNNRVLCCVNCVPQHMCNFLSSKLFFF